MHSITLLMILNMSFGIKSVAQISYPIDVAGIRLYSTLTEERVVEIFGTPDDHYVSDDGSLVGFVETYFYGKNSLSFVNGKLNGFDVHDDNWVVMSECFENGLRVGMPLSIITKDTRYRLLPHNRLKDTYWILDDPLPENVPDAYIMITVSEGKIVTISYNELN